MIYHIPLLGKLNCSMFKRLVFSVFMWESLGVYVKIYQQLGEYYISEC